MSWISYSTLLLILYFKGFWCLKILSLQIPDTAVVGETIQLTCDYDLEKDNLYAVKWYKDDIEFFRFLHSEKPQTRFFTLLGIQLDMAKSSDRSVVLQNIDENTGGTYRCEVSGSFPTFNMVSTERVLLVSDDQACCKSSTEGTHFRVSLLISASLLWIFF